MREWLTKVRRYPKINGVWSSSVIADFDDKEDAEFEADRYNTAYQTDSYYVERNHNYAPQA